MAPTGNKGDHKGRPYKWNLPLRLFSAGSLAVRLAFRLLFGLEVFAGLLVDHLHRQPDLTAFVEAQQLDLHLVAVLDDIRGLLHPSRRELADVHEAVARAEEIHECAEVHHLHDRAVVDHPDLRIGRNRLDPVDGGLDRLAGRRGDLEDRRQGGYLRRRHHQGRLFAIDLIQLMAALIDSPGEEGTVMVPWSAISTLAP